MSEACQRTFISFCELEPRMFRELSACGFLALSLLMYPVLSSHARPSQPRDSKRSEGGPRRPLQCLLLRLFQT